MVGHGKQVKLDSLNEGCVSEAMVEGLARFLSCGQHNIWSAVQKWCHSLTKLTQTKISDVYYLVVLLKIYVDTTILTDTTKVDLVLCTQ